MTTRLKIFLISFVLSLFFWSGMNVLAGNLEDFLFWQKIAATPRLLTAEMNQKILEQETKVLKTKKEDLEIDAEAIISVEIDKNGNEKVLYEKNSHKLLPIASLTKLMTANIVLENFDLSHIVQVSEEAVGQKEDFGEL